MINLIIGSVIVFIVFWKIYGVIESYRDEQADKDIKLKKLQEENDRLKDQIQP